MEANRMTPRGIVRHVVPRPGLKGWAHGDRGLSLPAGLQHRSPVEVLERVGWRDLVVSGKGGLWQVVAGAIDCGREYRTRRGEWIPESDERARRYLLKLREAIHRGDQDKVYVHNADYQRRMIAEVEWMLERNGWEFPPLPVIEW